MMLTHCSAANSVQCPMYIPGSPIVNSIVREDFKLLPSYLKVEMTCDDDFFNIMMPIDRVFSNTRDSTAILTPVI